MLPSTRAYLLFWSLALAATIVLLWLFNAVLLPFVAGAAVAYLLNPLVIQVMGRGYSRTTATGLIVGVFLFLVVVLFVCAIPVIAREISLLANGLPGTISTLRQFAETNVPWLRPVVGHLDGIDWWGQISRNMGRALSVGTGVLSGVVNGTQAVVGFISFIAIMPVVAFFITAEWPHITKAADDLLPRKSAPTIRALVARIDEKISGFIRGQMLVCAMLAAYYMLTLGVIGLKYGVLIGFMSGVLALIPFVGSVFALVAAVLVALWQMQQDGIIILILPVIAILVGQFVEGTFITPKIVGDRVGLHPLWIIFALMAGGSLLGLLGMFVAVPVAAAISVLVVFGIDQYKSSPYYTEAIKPTTPRPS